MINIHRLKELRGSKTQALIALKARISVNHYSQIEKGVKNPSIGVAKRIANIYGVPVDDLLS
jgi:transcriptional regulator with XRE-family HTH domain